MASLGAAKTGKFAIGTAELRVGPLNMAGKLTKAYSVGLIDAATLNVEQTSVDLKGGFPQVIMDTQVTDQSAQITATLREFSRRNLGILLGQGLLYSANTDVGSDALTTLSADLAADATAISLAASTNFAAGDWISIYDEFDAGNSIITRLGADTSSIDANFTSPLGFTSGARVSRLEPIAVGNVSSVNYFTAQLITLDRATGRPKVSNFWKLTIGSGMSLANNATDFASTEMVLKVLQPSMTDYTESTAPMFHLKDIIGQFPMGMMGEMSDLAVAGTQPAGAPVTP